MNVHPIARLFPPMSDAQYAALRDDIRENGQREPITLWQGQVIDGLHRARACDELGIAPVTREWEGEESGLTAYVVSLNLHRRHLSESQRAMVAEKITAKGFSRKPEDRAENGLMSMSESAKLLNVGRTSVAVAREVRRDAVSEVVAAVEGGNLGVYRAAQIAKLPAAEQRAALATPRAHNPHLNKHPTKGIAERIHRTVESMVNMADILSEALPSMNGDKRRSEWATSLRDVRTTLTRFITECER